jgi:hypothetical protein
LADGGEDSVDAVADAAFEIADETGSAGGQAVADHGSVTTGING